MNIKIEDLKFAPGDKVLIRRHDGTYDGGVIDFARIEVRSTLKERESLQTARYHIVLERNGAKRVITKFIAAEDLCLHPDQSELFQDEAED